MHCICAVLRLVSAVLCCAGRLARAFEQGYYCDNERELRRKCGVSFR